MPSWHRLGTEAELTARVPFAVKVERHRIAIFQHDGRLRAISDICNHRGGPLSDGRLHGEFVMCPWHAWEYSVITGKGPEGYDEEQVPVYRLETRDDGVYVELPPVMPRRLLKHKPSHLLEPHPKPADAPPRVLGISTTGMDAVNPRFSTSDCLLEHAVGHLGAQGADTQRDPAPRAHLSPLRRQLLQGVARVHLAMRHHRARPDRRAHAGLRGPGALGRRRAHRHADSLGQRLLALLQDGRAAQLHSEPAHDSQPPAHHEQGGRAHHHRRPGQHPGGRGRDADVLVRARLRVPRVPVHRPLARVGRGGHAEQRAAGARERAAAHGRRGARRPRARHLARARPPSRRDGGADGARRAGRPTRSRRSPKPKRRPRRERPHAHRPRLRGVALRRTHGRGGRGLHRRRRVLGGGRSADRRRMARTARPCFAR